MTTCVWGVSCRNNRQAPTLPTQRTNPWGMPHFTRCCCCCIACCCSCALAPGCLLILLPTDCCCCTLLLSATHCCTPLKARRPGAPCVTRRPQHACCSAQAHCSLSLQCPEAQLMTRGGCAAVCSCTCRRPSTAAGTLPDLAASNPAFAVAVLQRAHGHAAGGTGGVPACSMGAYVSRQHIQGHDSDRFSGAACKKAADHIVTARSE